ncbi:MAG: PcfJ domain-containing protein [Phascolarctobacterium sp.]|nr:PcfJ domain-containing protein [Phascolarctobacterium sp.]
MALISKRNLLAMSVSAEDDVVVSGKTSKALIHSQQLDDNTLAVYFYTRYNKKYRLLYSVFVELFDGKIIDESEFTTRDYSEAKWRTGKIDTYIWKTMDRNSWEFGLTDSEKDKLILPMFEDSLEALSKVCEESLATAWEAWLELNNKQENIQKNRLNVGYKKDIERFNAVNSKVPELPAEVTKWVRTYLMDGYCIYDYKTRKGQCTSCLNTVNVPKGVKRNDEFKCPNCHRRTTALPCRKYAINDSRSFTVAQATSTGMVLRKYWVHRDWASILDKLNKPKELFVNEVARCFIDNDGSHEFYVYGTYKLSGQSVWYKNDADFGYRMETSAFYLDSYKFLEGTKFYWLVMQGKHRTGAWSDFIAYTPYPYFIAGAKYPVIETLAKNGKFGLLKVIVGYPKDFVVKNVSCDYRALGIPKAFREEIICDAFSEMYGSKLKTIRKLYEKFGHLNSDTIKFIKNFDCDFETACALLGPTGNCLKGVKYINGLFYTEGYHAFRDYKDYVDMCRQLNIKLTKQVLYPQNFRAAHDEAASILNEKKDAAENAQFIVARDNLAKVFKSYADDNYLVRLPKSANEVKQEGLRLHHCVGSYVPRVINGSSVILFVRDKNKSDVPFYTLELSPKDFHVVQCRTKHNASAPAEVMEFVNKYVGTLVADANKNKKSA